MSLGGSYNTGIQSGPSLSGQDYQTALNRYNQIGRAPMSRPIGPAYGGAPPAAGGMFNQGRAALGTDAGNQASNAFSNTVNQGQSQLAAGQAGAQSQIGNATQGSLANIYNQALGRGADLNTAQTNNLLNRQRLGYGLAGNLFGTGMGLAGQAISPLLNGIFSGIGSIPAGLQNLMQPGLSGGLPQSQVGGIGNNALSSILAGLGGSNPLASIGMGGGLGGGLA
jgi:hypothetical protein